ncbi:MAG TPA: hydantoinase B/oxoprolinase family protein [Geminicoccaceae bacterium]|nr:hydantoinase B/oxoprolinase family protein [Geminicoccaceae bacterium]
MSHPQHHGRAALADIRKQIMWNRLIAVVEEQAMTLLRTAFSPIVRECGDLSAGVFDRRGRMLAQAVTGTPGHVNSMARSVAHFIRHFPLETMREGDIYICNDPWMGTGHLHDFVLTTPTFHKGKLVALFSCTSHLIDIGGIGFGPDGKDVFAEGLYIPMLKLAEGGRMNETLLAMVRANSREPVQAEGDVYSLAACNDTGCERLVEMLEEFGLGDIEELGDYIVDQSRHAVLAEIARLPAGTYRNTMRVDGYDQELELVAALTISGDGIHVDYEGTSPVSNYGINVPKTYCEAYTCFGLACAIAPTVPNNAGSLSPYRVAAPEGCILNAPYPSPVATRHVIGQMLPDVVFGCLHQAIPGRVPAEGTACLWTLTLGNGRGGNAPRFMVNAVHNGGTGARPTKDGLSATAYPSGVRGTPAEITEQTSPLIFWRKELRPDSAGPGRQRGGLGQVIEVEHRQGAPFTIWAAFDRIKHPPRGREGGRNGSPGAVGLGDGSRLNGKGAQEVPPGARLVVHTPGGAGYGDPRERKAEAVARDLRDGTVTAEAAERDYGYAVAAREPAGSLSD